MKPKTRLWPFILLFLLLAVACLLFANYRTMLIIAVLCLLPILLSFLLRLVRMASIGQIVLLLTLAILAALMLVMISPSLYRARRERLQCDKYAMRLRFDPAHNTFKGDQEITVSGAVSFFEIAEAKSDLIDNLNANAAAPGNPHRRGNRNSRANDGNRTNGNTNFTSTPKLDAADWEKLTKMLDVKSGQSVQPDDNPVMEALAQTGLTGWTIKDIEIVQAGDAEEPESVHIPVRVQLVTNEVDLKTEKKGLFKYASEIRPPAVVNFDQEKQGCQAEVILFAPKDAFLTHNLNGTFSETTLENNEVGQALTATKVRDRNNIIRFNYASTFFQSPLTNKILNFSFLNAVLYLGSLVLGFLGYLLGIAIDVFKDARLKPAATRFLSWLRLIKKPPEKP